MKETFSVKRFSKVVNILHNIDQILNLNSLLINDYLFLRSLRSPQRLSHAVPQVTGSIGLNFFLLD